jgi:hypothetical protein
VLVSGIWDLTSGRNIGIHLPGNGLYLGWHTLSSLLLLLYLIVHVIRRRKRLRRSHIRLSRYSVCSVACPAERMAAAALARTPACIV